VVVFWKVAPLSFKVRVVELVPPLSTVRSS
jgi:hypothetical protein